MPRLVIDTDDTPVPGAPPPPAEALEGVAELMPPAAAAGGPLDDLVPIALFFAIAVTYCVKYYFAFRTRRDAQQSVRTALERGEPLTPELLDRLVQAPAPKSNDLRRGVIGVALGIGLGAFGVALGEESVVRPMLAVGCVPLLIGAAYLLLWRLGRVDERR
jgi:hypothetical protein